VARDGDELPRLDRQGEIPQRMRLDLRGSEHLAHALHHDHRVSSLLFFMNTGVHGLQGAATVQPQHAKTIPRAPDT
jgi:hypothetical protein